MAEYIEREKLAKALKIWQNTLIENYGESDEYVRCLNSVLLGVDNVPAADVRPVVLCRDCTFFKPQQKSKRWSSTTPMCSRSATIKMPPDGFCSFGVKREES